MTETNKSNLPEPLPAIVASGFENRWAPDLNDTDYHADKTAVSSSVLKKMMKSEAHFLHAFTNGDDEPTEAMKFGTLAHLAILQGDEFMKRYIVEPEFWGYTQKGEKTNSLNCKDVQVKRAAWFADLPPGAVVVTAQQRDDILGMVESVLAHSRARELLSQGQAEVAGYFRCPRTGIKSRIKPDFLSFNLNALLDVKTCVDASDNGFGKSVVKLRYDFQMAMYATGVEAITGKAPDHCAWIAIEKTAPYLVEVHEVSEQFMLTGAYEYRKAMDRLKAALEAKSFPKRNADINVLAPPYWFAQDYQLKGVL